MKLKLTKTMVSVASAIFLFAGTGSANADEGNHYGQYSQECPVGSPYGSDTFASMFGSDVVDALRCNKKRNHVRIVVQVNNFCRDAVANVDCTRAYALGNMKNMIKDLEITHGMSPKDYKMVAVVHSGGGHLLRKVIGKDASNNPIPNQFAGDVQELMDKGVEFYFCLNTAASFVNAGALTKGNISPQLIDGVKYVPAGLDAIVDFQNVGYTYVQP